MNIKKIIQNLESKSLKKNFYNLLIVLLIGVLIILVSSFFTNDKKSATAIAKKETSKEENVIKEQEVNDVLSSYEASQKDQLKTILSSIEGVGKVEVMLTLESTSEKVPAVDVTKSTTNTNEKDNSGGTRENVQQTDGTKIVMSNTGDTNTPLILKVLNPKINGVVIVAEGGENKTLQYNIIKTVSTLYNIPEHKVSVFSMKK